MPPIRKELTLNSRPRHALDNPLVQKLEATGPQPYPAEFVGALAGQVTATAEHIS